MYLCFWIIILSRKRLRATEACGRGIMIPRGNSGGRESPRQRKKTETSREVHGVIITRWLSSMGYFLSPSSSSSSPLSPLTFLRGTKSSPLTPLDLSTWRNDGGRDPRVPTMCCFGQRPRNVGCCTTGHSLDRHVVQHRFSPCCWSFPYSSFLQNVFSYIRLFGRVYLIYVLTFHY